MSEWQILHHPMRHHLRVKMYKIHFDWTSHCGVMHWNAMESSSQPWPSFPECPGSKCWLMEPEDGFSSQCGFGNQKVVSAAKEWTQQSRWPLCRGHHPPLNTVMRVASWVSPHHVASVGFYGFNPEHNRLVNEQTNCNILKLNFTVYRDPKSVCQSVPVYLCCILS